MEKALEERERAMGERVAKAVEQARQDWEASLKRRWVQCT
jgi:hypothetical protein